MTRLTAARYTPYESYSSNLALDGYRTVWPTRSQHATRKQSLPKLQKVIPRPASARRTPARRARGGPSAGRSGRITSDSHNPRTRFVGPRQRAGRPPSEALTPSSPLPLARAPPPPRHSLDRQIQATHIPSTHKWRTAKMFSHERTPNHAAKNCGCSS